MEAQGQHHVVEPHLGLTLVTQSLDVMQLVAHRQHGGLGVGQEQDGAVLAGGRRGQHRERGARVNSAGGLQDGLRTAGGSQAINAAEHVRRLAHSVIQLLGARSFHGMQKGSDVGALLRRLSRKVPLRDQGSTFLRANVMQITSQCFAWLRVQALHPPLTHRRHPPTSGT